MRLLVDRFRTDLERWISSHDGEDLFADPPGNIVSAHNATEVTAALLETAIDRQINLHGEADARNLILRTFDRRAKVWRQRLQ